MILSQLKQVFDGQLGLESFLNLRNVIVIYDHKENTFYLQINIKE
jgi:hypothetical protein